MFSSFHCVTNGYFLCVGSLEFEEDRLRVKESDETPCYTPEPGPILGDKEEEEGEEEEEKKDKDKDEEEYEECYVDEEYLKDLELNMTEEERTVSTCQEVKIKAWEKNIESGFMFFCLSVVIFGGENICLSSFSDR